MVKNDEKKLSFDAFADHSEDDYDFLEDLMGSMGSSEEEESDKINDDRVDVDDTEDWENLEEEEVLHDTEPKPVRRVPLFQQMQMEQSGKDEEGEDDLEDPFAEDAAPVEVPFDGVNDEDLFDTYVEDPFAEDLEDDKDVIEESEEELSAEDDYGKAWSQGTSAVEDMLSAFDEAEREEALDDEVKVPLETKEMREVKVTADGRTLADMLPGMRGGGRTAREVVGAIRNQETVVKVGDKKFSDDRYVKHVKKIEDKRAEQDKRRELSAKFLQRNAQFTEHEKIIMENLGISNEGFANLMKSKKLTEAQKREIIGLGRYGAEKHFKGRRYRTTVGDTAMLEFLSKFKFANTRILRWISNEPQGRSWRKLNRLRENGLVESQTLIGIPDLWAATPAGIGLAGYSYEPGLRPLPKMATISATMGVNYLAACLWFNTVNVLNLDDFPAENRVIATQEDGRERVRGEMLVSELEIRSSLGKEINPQSTTMKTLGDERLYDVIASNVRHEFDVWKENGRAGISPEMMPGNEYMWVLFPSSQLTLSYHVPDLIVKRDRGANGEPKSIAVELERYEKTNDRYEKTMLAYKLDHDLYEKVIWVTPNMRVARALEKAAKAVDFHNYTIIPIITETGVYSKPDIWMI